MRICSSRAICASVSSNVPPVFTTKSDRDIFLVRRPLCGEPLARGVVGQTSLDEALELHFRRAGGDDHAVETLLGAGLVEQRHVHDRQCVAHHLERADTHRDRTMHGRVNDRFELAAR